MLDSISLEINRNPVFCCLICTCGITVVWRLMLTVWRRQLTAGRIMHKVVLNCSKSRRTLYTRTEHIHQEQQYVLNIIWTGKGHLEWGSKMLEPYSREISKWKMNWWRRACQRCRQMRMIQPGYSCSRLPLGQSISPKAFTGYSFLLRPDRLAPRQIPGTR